MDVHGRYCICWLISMVQLFHWLSIRRRDVLRLHHDLRRRLRSFFLQNRHHWVPGLPGSFLESKPPFKARFFCHWQPALKERKSKIMWNPLPKVEKYQFTIFQVNGKHIIILPILKFWITVLALIQGICIMPSSWFHEGRRANKKKYGIWTSRVVV